MHRWNARIGHRRDQADPGCPKAGILRGTWNGFGIIGWKRAHDCGDMHANFLKQAALHDSHYAAAASRFFAVPRRADKSAGTSGVKRRVCFVFEGFKRLHDLVAQGFKPCSCLCFTVVLLAHSALVCRSCAGKVVPVSSLQR